MNEPAKRLKCPHCSDHVADRNELRNHAQKKHAIVGAYHPVMKVCPECTGEMSAQYFNGVLQGFNCNDCNAFMLVSDVDRGND